jgi:hypothetical protein
MQNPDPEVRSKAVKALASALAVNTTPVQFLALFALSATDPVEANVTASRKALEFAVSYRRQILAQIAQFHPAIAPESAIPYLVNILSHHENFEEDKPDLPTFHQYLRFFLVPLCAETTDFDRILNIFMNLSMLEDVEGGDDGEYTKNMAQLCDIGSAIVKEIGGGRNWSLITEGVGFEYSTRYFKAPESNRRLKELLRSGDKKGKSPKLKGKILRAGMSPVIKSPKRKKKAVEEDEEEPRKGGKKGRGRKREKSPSLTDLL